ncbi:hypothetical protein MRY87_11510 [bacterium]|nr:hypothetical protein [bacterium]
MAGNLADLITNNSWWGVSLAGVVILNLGTAITVLLSLRTAAKERTRLNRETFGLLKKVEGLLAQKQEKMKRDYDELLENMTGQVPITIARKVGKDIYETEKSVLMRLAEIEPQLEGDSLAVQKMEAIIKSMEKLETTVIDAASKAVEQTLREKRRTLFSEPESLPSDYLRRAE